MTILATARALVLDDKYEEVKPVILALARLGIGSVYLSGNVDEMPEDPLHGIRLAIVDMDLTGADAEPEAIAGHTLHVLEQVLHADANPLMVIVWTGSEDTFKVFSKRFTEKFPMCAPGIVHHLDKTQFDLASEAGIAAAATVFRETIEAQLADARPLDLFWSWEQAVHDAASRTTSAVANIVQEGRVVGGKKVSWPVASSNVLAALARASSGQQGNTPEKLLDDLCSGLEPLLLDRLEHHRVPKPELVAGSAQLIFETADEQKTAIKAAADYKKELTGIQAFKARLGKVLWDTVDFIMSRDGRNLEANAGRKRNRIEGLISNPAKPDGVAFAATQAARLNTMLHLSILSEDNPVRPGNIYLVGAAGTETHDALSALGFNEEQLRKDTFNSTKAGGPIVLVEATPACDYAQGKWTMARFVAGFLAPETAANGLQGRAEFIRPYGPLWLELAGGEAEIAHLILNSHFAPSLGMDEVAKWAPVYMLRRRTLTDLQVWLSSQHMRQGLLNVT